MKIPEWVKPAVWGGVTGAVALAIVGFSAGWVVMNGTATKMADARADKAVLAAMTPICIAQFKVASAAANLVDSDTAKSDAKDVKTAPKGALLAAFMKVDSWKRDEFVSKQGWATMPGSKTANSDVARACASELTKLASADKK